MTHKDFGGQLATALADNPDMVEAFAGEPFFETEMAGYRIAAYQYTNQWGAVHYATQYGLQLDVGHDYESCCLDIGAAVMHAAGLEGKLDNNFGGEE